MFTIKKRVGFPTIKLLLLLQVLYRTAMAILILFQKSSSSASSEWLAEIQKNGVDSALTKFCKEIPVSPQKLLKVAFGIRGLSSSYISRVFLKTEMILRSKNVINGSRPIVRSRSSENLPNSQSQNNIQMVSHTLTIREVSTLIIYIQSQSLLMVYLSYK